MVRLPLVSIFAVAAVLTAALPALADVTVGVAGPMTGPFASLGAEMKNGAAQAVADINKAGGVNGQMLHLEVVDDACDAKTADAVANQLTGKGAALVVGHVCLAASQAGAQVYAQNKIIEITPATTYPEFTDQRVGPGVFRLAERDDEQGMAIGAFLADRYAVKNVAIVNDDSSYGKNLANDVRLALTAAGQHEAIDLSYTANAADFSDLVSKLNAAMTDVVFIGGADLDAGKIVKALRASGSMAQIVGGDTLASNLFWQTAGMAAQGTLIALPYDFRQGFAAAMVVAAFRATKIEPEGYVLPSYAAVQIWAAAAGQAKTFAFDKVVAALESGTFSSVIGNVQFDTKGDADLPGFVLYQWHDGRYDPLSQ